MEMRLEDGIVVDLQFFIEKHESSSTDGYYHLKMLGNMVLHVGNCG